MAQWGSGGGFLVGVVFALFVVVVVLTADG